MAAKQNPTNDICGVKSSLAEKTILIAGGAGSIGSAVARMAVEWGAKEVLLLDIDENGLAETVMRLEEFGHHNISAFVCDLKSQQHVNRIFTAKPHMVVNCAAHKHVVTSERNVSQTILNNLLTTHRPAIAAIENRVESFTHISTDKAVEPTSVMGASKMLCESMVRELFSPLSNGNAPHWYIVRFGNVLDSQGSVLRIWRRQLNENKPLTVTNPNMKRFCISIKSACELILRLPQYPSGTYVLDMGTVMTVRELLERFLWPDVPEHHQIVVVGEKTGEKEEEKLFWPQERVTELTVGGRRLYMVDNSPSFSTSTAMKSAETYDDKETMRILKSDFPNLRTWD